MTVQPRVVLPRLLLDANLADISSLGMAAGIAAEGDVSLVHALVRWRLVPAAALCKALAGALALAPVSLADLGPGLPLPMRRAVCARLRVLPVWRRAGVLGLAMSDPTDDGAVAELTNQTGLSVERLLVDDDDLERCLRRCFASDGEALAAVKSSPPQPPRQPPHPGPDQTVPMAAARAPQAMRVVLGEPSVIDQQIPDAASMMFVDAVSISMGSSPSEIGEFEGQTSGVFTSDTIDIPMHRPRVAPTVPPLSPQRSRTGSPVPALSAMPHLDDLTREVDMRDAAALLADATIVGGNAAAVVPAQASDDRTVPSDDVLSLMRVLVVADDVAGPTIRQSLAGRLKHLEVVPLHVAGSAMDKSRYDEVVIVDPPSSVMGSQLVAGIAARAKRGVVVLTNTADIGRLPGVRETVAFGGDGVAVGDLLLGVLSRRAHGL
jgi:hypothetical protein